MDIRRLKRLPASVSMPEDHLGYWLRYVSNNVAFALSQKLEAQGVTVAEWIILRQMYLQDWVSPRDMAFKTGLSPGAISKLMDRLLAKKLVTKATSHIDRRYKTMKLTERGAKLVPALAKIAKTNDDYFFGNLSSIQKKTLIDFFKNMAKAHRLRKSLNMRLT